ncbi:hypothetical protein MASR2M117_11630 [Paludibacter sp.]
MKLRLVTFFTLICLYTNQSFPQTDITEHVLKNAGFDNYFNYDINTKGNISGDIINDIYGWEKDAGAAFTVAGTFAYGSGATFNGSSTIPNSGFNGSTGGALALSTGWDVSLKYFQPVKLPKGEYIIVSAYNNVGSTTVGTSLTAWVPSSGQVISSSVSSYPIGKWITDTIRISLTNTTEGKIQTGYKAGGSGSANSAKILIDYIKILYQGVDKTELENTILEAEALYNVDGIDANILLENINSAKEVRDNSNADMAQVIAAINVLNDAIDMYKLRNASVDSPINMTMQIINPSFESGFTGWTNDGFATQTNTVFPFKDGSTYIEKWVSRGSRIPDVEVKQLITNIPNGKYRLIVAAGHIQQTGAGSYVNNSATPQTGAGIFANSNYLQIDTVKERNLDFFVLDNQVTLGLKAQNATGNWLTCDNFRLLYIGFDINDMSDYVRNRMQDAQTLLTHKMQNSAKQNLNTAINQANNAINANPLVVEDLNQADNMLTEAIDIAKISIKAYVDLQIAINEAVDELADKTGNNAAALESVIEMAQTVFDNLDASIDAIYKEVKNLSGAILAFRIDNGTGTIPKVITNTNYARGATAAFGRSTISGVGINTLLEHGFCWSTHPNPSVTDNRTTKYFSNKGYIYHIENLEPSTVYYMRAYALTKTYAIGYGDVIKVVTIPKGTITYTLNSSVTSADGHHERIKKAMESAVNYWNNLTGIQGKHLSVNHHPGTPTAEASYSGYMQFGANSAYQQTGTALHEMGHTIGVGQHGRWYGPDSPLRANGTRGQWLGERANKVVQFLENNINVTMGGDAVHMWASGADNILAYGINGAHEDSGSDLLYIGNSLITQGLGEDGLPPTGGFATPYYSFESEDNIKYYIKSEDESTGLSTSFLTESKDGKLVYKALSSSDVLENDSCAWYLSFNPSTAYYNISNVATGKFFSYKNLGANGVSLISKTKPSDAENFQLMKSRTEVQIGSGDKTFKAKGFWITRPEKTLTPPTFTAGANGNTTATELNFVNSATKQRWLILTKDEVNHMNEALAPSATIKTIFEDVNIYSIEGNIHINNIKKPVDIYLYDIVGKLFFHMKCNDHSFSKPMDNGIYIVNLKSKEGECFKKVIIK